MINSSLPYKFPSPPKKNSHSAAKYPKNKYCNTIKVVESYTSSFAIKVLNDIQAVSHAK